MTFVFIDLSLKQGPKDRLGLEFWDCINIPIACIIPIFFEM